MIAEVWCSGKTERTTYFDTTPQLRQYHSVRRCQRLCYDTFVEQIASIFFEIHCRPGDAWILKIVQFLFLSVVCECMLDNFGVRPNNVSLSLIVGEISTQTYYSQSNMGITDWFNHPGKRPYWLTPIPKFTFISLLKMMQFQCSTPHAGALHYIFKLITTHEQDKSIVEDQHCTVDCTHTRVTTVSYFANWPQLFQNAFKDLLSSWMCEQL